MLARVGANAAGGDHQVVAAFQHRAPMPIEVRDEFRRREHRVMAQPARDGARMTSGADTFNHPMADVAADSGHDAYGQLTRQEHRTLLDMQFEPGGEALRINQRLA